MANNQESGARAYWNKTWNKFLKFQGMIAPSSKLVQHLCNVVPRNGFIIDLGCGEGRNSLYLQQVGYKILGVDLSEKAIRVMKNNFFEEDLRGLPIVCDARQLAIKSESVDGILAHHIFDHLDYKGFQLAIKESLRVLKVGGALLMTLDNFSSSALEKGAVLKDDGAIVFTEGPRKGMLVRPFKEEELNKLSISGWKVLKNELTPQKSKILLLEKKEAHKA
jgi:ubiquinone/menaquinone biosynthesis C-methylase UbiE